MPGPFGPGGVAISGFAMLQHQIKAAHESAHQDEKQRQDQGDMERRPPFSTRSPTILDRDGKRAKHDRSRSVFTFVLFILTVILVLVAPNTIYSRCTFPAPFSFLCSFEGEAHDIGLDFNLWFSLCQDAVGLRFEFMFVPIV